MDTKLKMSHLCVPVSETMKGILGCTRTAVASRLRKLIHLLSSGEATLRALGPVLGSPVKEKHRHIGESLVKGHEDD